MNTNIRVLLIFFLLSCFAFAYSQGNTLDESIEKRIKIDEKKITIIDFFASWCVSCEKELPLIQKLVDKKMSNVDFVGIDTDEEIKKGLLFQKKLKLNMRIINDTNQEIVSNFNPIGMPAIYFVKNQKIKKVIYGAIDNIDKVILEILEEIK